MRIFLRSLTLAVACALTGATTALLVTTLTVAAPVPTCPPAPILEIHPYTPHVAPPPPPAPPPPARHSRSLEPSPLPEGAVHCTTEEDCHLRAALFASLVADPSLLAHQARIMPSIRDGVTRGFKLYGLRPGSLPRLLGIKNGDLVTAINGVRLVSFADLARQLAVPDRGTTLVLDIIRKGQPMQRRIHLD